MHLLLFLAQAGSVGRVALMTFTMDQPYGFGPPTRVEGDLFLSGQGAWMRAGFGRPPTLETPRWTGFQETERWSVAVGARTATVTVGTATLADGTPVTVFEGVFGDPGMPPFVMQAVVPDPRWLPEVQRTLVSVELHAE